MQTLTTEQYFNERLERIEDKVDELISQTAELRGSTTTRMLIQWVIFPLVSILAASFGVKEIFASLM